MEKIKMNYVRTTLTGLILLLIVGMISGCGIIDSTQVQEEKIEIRELTRQEKSIVTGANSFSMELLQTLAKKEKSKSFVASPLSISLAFGMLMNGAEGSTYDELTELFGLESLSREEINAAAKALIPLLIELDPDVTTRIANSIWSREGIEINETFLTQNKESYYAQIQALDFTDPASVDIINNWVNQQTEGLIEEILQEIPELAILYLVNAIYFKADWTIQFDPEKTMEEPFFKADGSEPLAPLMRVKEEFEFFENEKWRAVQLPYGGEAYAFFAIQPLDYTDLESFSYTFSDEDYHTILSNLKADTVQVYLPKFELDYKIQDFKNDLVSMGLTEVFSSDANLTRIHPSLDLYVSDVLHQAVLKVDEKGSEAAAVTTIEIRVTSVGPTEPTIRLDRPFLFFIRETGSDTILFMGRYSG
jgi:serpin B